jgi:enamine deaminase RidA (YjgF/YER057c/UK114 family)
MASNSMLLLRLLLLGSVCVAAQIQERKVIIRKPLPEKEEPTQVLRLPPEPPATVAVEAGRLRYYVTPLSGKGLLSQQARDGLKAIRNELHGGRLMKLRVWLAGSGDLRRVPMLVAEQMDEWKLSTPSVSVVQVGLLPMEAAQVQMEAVISDKREQAPGIVFFAGQQITDPDASKSAAPLVERSLVDLEKAVQAVGLDKSSVLRVTCFASNLMDTTAMYAAINGKFPGVPFVLLQPRRLAAQGLAECEAIGRDTRATQSREAINPPGLPSSPNYSQAMRTNAKRLVFTTAQSAYGSSEADVQLAFERLKKLTEAGQASLQQVLMTTLYPLTETSQAAVRKLRSGFFNMSPPAASTMLLFEGLPAREASVGLEVVLALN